ncbi:sensor domain-containing protein, partial [Mycobacterium avium subsp. paratuberculosis]
MAILVVASLLPGCGRTDTPTTKETTTTSGKSVETLLVNLDDVRRIADTESLNSGPGSQVQ